MKEPKSFWREEFGGWNKFEEGLNFFVLYWQTHLNDTDAIEHYLKKDVQALIDAWEKKQEEK